MLPGIDELLESFMNGLSIEWYWNIKIPSRVERLVSIPLSSYRFQLVGIGSVEPWWEGLGQKTYQHRIWT